VSDRRNGAFDGSDVDVDWVDEAESRLAWLRAVMGIAWAQLTFDKMRTTLAVTGVVLAVLATTLLAGTGIGVVETGQQKFDTAGRDLWITGGPLQLSPGTIGGIDSGITDAHQIRKELYSRENVRTATPLLFQTVYASPNGSDFRTIAAVGYAGTSKPGVTKGRVFADDTHYASGNYSGPWTYEVVIDKRTAETLNVSIGDSLYIGGTVSTAARHEFVVVGYSPTGRNLLGVPSVAMRLSELQELTGRTGADPATLVTVTLHDEVDVSQAEAELQSAYPKYEVRTNQEQLRATIRRQATVIAGGASLVVLAIVAGLTLTLNVLLSMIEAQRTRFAALMATGCSARTLAGIVTMQVIAVGLAGAVIGVGLTLPVAFLLDVLAETVTGFENVVRTPIEVLLLGFVSATLTSVVSVFVSGRSVNAIAIMKEL
jgi:putative ABC transport system permease protein